jgi:hypothetical protein
MVGTSLASRCVAVEVGAVALASRGLLAPSLDPVVAIARVASLLAKATHEVIGVCVCSSSQM